jgi:hypothetical protein
MALSKDIEFKGISVPSAYHRVWNVSLSKESISFGLSVHADAGGEMLSSTAHECEYDIDGENPIRQAYMHIKTLPDFAGATDC